MTLLLVASLLLISCEGDGGEPQETNPAVTQAGGSGDYGSVIFPDFEEH